MYNSDNIFAKIIRKEINCEVIYEDDKVLAFNDIAPAAPIHILVIPKGPYINFNDFCSNAEKEFIAHYFNIITKITKTLDVKSYRVISNVGQDASQTVEHFHSHILAGKKLGGLLQDDQLIR